ncbi:hypothetical protein ES705_18994 [subsurface metagenome]
MRTTLPEGNPPPRSSSSLFIPSVSPSIFTIGSDSASRIVNPVLSIIRVFSTFAGLAERSFGTEIYLTSCWFCISVLILITPSTRYSSRVDLSSPSLISDVRINVVSKLVISLIKSINLLLAVFSYSKSATKAEIESKIITLAPIDSIICLVLAIIAERSNLSV